MPETKKARGTKRSSYRFTDRDLEMLDAIGEDWCGKPKLMLRTTILRQLIIEKYESINQAKKTSKKSRIVS